MKITELKKGDILLCRPIDLPEGWLGRAIVWLTGGEVSHTALYCGKIGGIRTVAHSDLRGIIYMPLDKLIGEEVNGFYVARHSGRKIFSPVLKAAEKYASPYEDRNEEGGDNAAIPYPITDFGVLGLLILGNKFLPEAMLCRAFYDFALLIAVKIMKEINARHFDQRSMTCSQFASQCYTDAGAAYEIRFEKLLLRFGSLKQSDGKVSLLEMLHPDDTLELPACIDESILAREELVVDRFLGLAGGEAIAPENTVDKKEFHRVAALLLTVLCAAIAGKKPSSVREAIHIFSTNRNYLVTPDDLLSNASNLHKIGFMEGVTTRIPSF